MSPMSSIEILALDSAFIELVDLLTCANMEEDEREEALRVIAASPVELDWASSQAQAYSVALTGELHRHGASGDKLDEVHEQLQELMGDDFPGYPFDLTSSLEYYAWLDKQLQDWSEDGGYELVQIDDMCSDNMHCFVPYRKDTGRILELTEQLGLSAMRPLEYLRGLVGG
jgi:hypothetical protein